MYRCEAAPVVRLVCCFLACLEFLLTLSPPLLPRCNSPSMASLRLLFVSRKQFSTSVVPIARTCVRNRTPPLGALPRRGERGGGDVLCRPKYRTWAFQVRQCICMSLGFAAIGGGLLPQFQAQLRVGSKAEARVRCEERWNCDTVEHLGQRGHSSPPLSSAIRGQRHLDSQSKAVETFD